MGEEVEEIYQSLLKAGFTEEDITQEVNSKFNEYQGFMSKPAILFLIAKEKGITLAEYPQTYDYEVIIDYNDFLIPIAEITTEMSNKVITGRILKVEGIRSFTRKNGSKDIVGFFYIVDKSGNIKVVLWSDHAKILENKYFKKGIVVQVIGGYAKKGLNEKLEVHLNKKGKIVLSSEGKYVPELVEDSSESIENEQLQIQEVYNKEGFIKTITGTIKIDTFKELTLKNGECSFLLKFMLSDESSSIQVNVWGMQAVECLKNLSDGNKVKLYNIVIILNPYNNKKEISFTKLTRIQQIK